ncbi:hypothetical protein [Mycobacterium tuberculosis]|uniref:hypothetical protein n=1 Tax=Mycobacterium tuberculosis TaxID=1773 RepID=UPI000D3A0896|nr:hypothetical protein [Mycobacterium tuberculosis]
MPELETPDDPESIYLARLEDVGEHRPTFTGDIYRLGDGRMVMILQHPCALRHGVDLHPRLLVAPVRPDSLRSNWARAPFGTMPLPKLIDGQDHSADFINLELIDSPTLPTCERIAVLSQSGVNLVMQRWVYHSTRFAVPTHTYSDSTVGPFDEADLIEEWVTDRVDDGADPQAAEHECASWLDERISGRTRRALLSDRQHASSIRREARSHRKSVKLAD